MCEFHRFLQSSYDRIELVLVCCAQFSPKMIRCPETSVCWCEFDSITRNIVIVLLPMIFCYYHLCCWILACYRRCRSGKKFHYKVISSPKIWILLWGVPNISCHVSRASRKKFWRQIILMHPPQSFKHRPWSAYRLVPLSFQFKHFLSVLFQHVQRRGKMGPFPALSDCWYLEKYQ